MMKRGKEEGGRSAPWALTVSKCENFDPFLHTPKKKKHKKLILKEEGVNPYGQPARKKNVFLLTTTLNVEQEQRDLPTPPSLAELIQTLKVSSLGHLDY